MGRKAYCYVCGPVGLDLKLVKRALKRPKAGTLRGIFSGDF